MADHGDYSTWQSGAPDEFTNWWNTLSTQDQQFMNNWAWLIDNNQLPGSMDDQTLLRKKFNDLVGYTSSGWDPTAYGSHSGAKRQIEAIASGQDTMSNFSGLNSLSSVGYHGFAKVMGIESGTDSGASGQGGSGAGGDDPSKKVSDFLSMLLAPPSENDPSWQAIKANVSSQARQTASMFGASGGGAAGFVNQSMAGALGQYELQRLGLGLSAAGLQSQNLEQGYMNQMLQYSAELQRRQSGFGMVGGLLGGAAGAYFGGPSGAMAGYSIGSGAGSWYGGMGAGMPPSGPSFGYNPYGGGNMTDAIRGA